MIAPARVAAYEALRAVEQRPRTICRRRSRKYARPPARRARSRAGRRDRHRHAALAGGVRSHRQRRRPGGRLAQLDPEVLDILRLTIFQLLHLDRVPASAAVNDAVSLAQARGQAQRGTARQRGAAPRQPRARPSAAAAAPADATDREAALDYLSVTLSHPAWLADRWLRRHGFEAAEAWARFNNTPAPLTLRANRLRTTPDALAEALSRLRRAGRAGPLRAATRSSCTTGNPLLTPLAGDGTFFVQDEASQLVAVAGRRAAGRADPRRLRVAGRQDHGDGGGDGRPRADRRHRRARPPGRPAGPDRRARRGAQSVRVLQADAERPLPFRPCSTAVLLDAPCSGLGTIRRDPDVKWRRTEADLAALAAAQLRLLDQTAAVRPARRPAGLFDLLERARGERRRRRRRSWRTHDGFRAGQG